MYLETYGCQMNVNDTEIAWAILQKNGYARAKDLDEVRPLGSSPAAQVCEGVAPLLCLRDPGFVWSAGCCDFCSVRSVE